MENKARKMFAAVVVIMLCAVAIVGIGYAYTASTTNSGNTATSEYVTLTQLANGTSGGQYKFTDENQKIYYNTENTATETTKYKLDNSAVVNTNYTAIQLGKSFKIHAEQNTGGTYEDMTCAIDVTAGTVTLNSEWYILLKISTTNHEATPTAVVEWLVYNGTGWENDDNTFGIFMNAASSATAYNDAVVEVYYGYKTSTVPSTVPNATPLSGVSLTFTATHTGSNVAPTV